MSKILADKVGRRMSGSMPMMIPGLVLFLFFTLYPYPLAASHSDVWGVLVASIPDRVVLEKEGETVVSYILRQTHEPLFRKDDGQNFTSKILNNWSRSLNYTEYSFCPDTSLKFNASAGFSPDFFYTYLSSTTKRFSPSFSLEKKGECAIVHFPAARKGYLDFLTGYDVAPSINPEGNIAFGLGPFYVAGFTAKKVELRRKKAVTNGYNSVAFYAYSDADDNLKKSGISDFNKLPTSQQPEWISKDFQSFRNIELLSVGLGISHPDKSIREMLFNCIDTVKFREAYAPVTRKQFFDIKTVLPVGVPGAQPGKPDQRCRVAEGVKGKEIILANSRTNNSETLKQFADNFYKKTGLRIKVRDFAPNQMNPMLYDKKNLRPYNLIVLAVGALGTEISEFLKLYSGAPLAVDYVPGHVRKMFREIIKEEDLEKKNYMSVNLAEELNNEYLVLPLYQTAGTLYYPRKIKNLSVGRGFVEYPEVADLRW